MDLKFCYNLTCTSRCVLNSESDLRSQSRTVRRTFSTWLAVFDPLLAGLYSHMDHNSCPAVVVKQWRSLKFWSVKKKSQSKWDILCLDDHRGNHSFSSFNLVKSRGLDGTFDFSEVLSNHMGSLPSDESDGLRFSINSEDTME